MARVAVMFRTHRLSPGIIAEFSKIQAAASVPKKGSLSGHDSPAGLDAYILLDNDKCPLMPAASVPERGCLIPYEVKAGLYENGATNKAEASHDESDTARHKEETVFLSGQAQFNALGLPLLSHEPKPTAAGIKWFNGDYPAYAFRQALPDYDFYWMLDYDVFFNGPSYAPFFTHHAAKTADFLAASVEAACEDWAWSQHTDWAYAPHEKRIAFFPAVRFSGALLDALLPRRRAYGALYAATPAPKQWLSVELFVPSEAEKLGFSHDVLDNLGTFHCRESLDLGDDRIFEKPDNKLYHPVKGDFVVRLRRSEKRVAEQERELNLLREQNAALLAARGKRH